MHHNGRKWRGTKQLLDEGERRKWKSWLKTQHSKAKIMASGPITSWQISLPLEPPGSSFLNIILAASDKRVAKRFSWGETFGLYTLSQRVPFRKCSPRKVFGDPSPFLSCSLLRVRLAVGKDRQETVLESYPPIHPSSCYLVPRGGVGRTHALPIRDDCLRWPLGVASIS